MVNWDELPVELRQLIFEALRNGSAKRGGSWKVGHLACVNRREWRENIEAVTFSGLRLKNKEAGKFEELFLNRPRRQAALKYLCYTVELPRYSSRYALLGESDEEQDENDSAFAVGVWRLFSILSKWDANALVCDFKGTGMVLELISRSPSDKPQLFGERGISEEGDSRFLDSLLDMDMDAMPEPEGRFGLPEVRVVNGFCMLRQNHRYIAPRALLHILCSLPTLEWVDYEPYHLSNGTSQHEFDRDLAVQIPFWPTGLKKVNIFRHSDVFNTSVHVWGPDSKFPLLARNLERQSHDLQELTVSNLVLAEHFFQPFYHPTQRLRVPLWANLEVFAMTTELICSGADKEQFKELLMAVSRAVKRMPVLKLLEIYNAESHEGGVFQYNACAPDRASLRWKSTWHYTLPDDVRKAWSEAAKFCNWRRQLNEITESVIDTYKGPSKFIYQHLRTQPALMHPRSFLDLSPPKRTLPELTAKLLEMKKIRPTEPQTRRNYEIEQTALKITALQHEFERLQALDPNAEEADKRQGFYGNSHKFGVNHWGYFGPDPRKERIEVSYADGNTMDVDEDEEEDEDWETDMSEDEE